MGMDKCKQAAKVCLEVLEKMEIRKSYKSENELQKHMEEYLQEHISETYTLGTNSGKKCPRINALGTSFWPDLEIVEPATDKPLVGIEIKHIGSKSKSAASSISTAIGQSLIYKSIYDVVIIFIVNRGIYNKDLDVNKDVFIKNLAKYDLHLIMKR